MEDIKAMIASGNLVVALELLTERLAKEPDNVEALKMRGEQLLRMGDKKGGTGGCSPTDGDSPRDGCRHHGRLHRQRGGTAPKTQGK